MKPQMLHVKENVLVKKAGTIFGQTIILHEGEISSPDPEHLSPCYVPRKN